MPSVHENRIPERKGVNATRSLFEAHGHIVAEISGGSDFGEDLYVSFVEGGERTGVHIAVQVKSGQSFRRANGYGVAPAKHALGWRVTNIPVVCVVYDLEMRALYWENATAFLRDRFDAGKPPATIAIARSRVLGPGTLDAFVGEMSDYLEVMGTQRGALSKLRLSATRRAGLVDDAPVGGRPNELFAPVAKFLDDHPRVVKGFLIGLMMLIVAVLLVYMAPTFVSFADRIPFLKPFNFLAMLYTYLSTGIALAIYEARAGRSSRVIKAFTFGTVSVTYFVELGLQAFDSELLSSISLVWAAVVPAIVHYSLLLGALYFIGREVDRRRRVKARRLSGAYAEDDD